MISGNHNVQLIIIGLVWYSLRFGLSCPQFFGASDSESKWSLEVVNTRAA